MAGKSTFTCLGEDILHIVIDQLQIESPLSSQRFCLVSKFCRELVEPYLFRSIELSDDHKELETSVRKVGRLLDPNDRLSRQVRDLTILRFERESERLSEIELEKVIGVLFRLHSFRWNANSTIPERVICKLEQQWPSAKLIVENYSRADMDLRLLNSHLLHSLSFCVLNRTATVTATSQLAQFSLFRRLREVLLKSSNLKNLDVKFKYNWMPANVDWSGVIPCLLNLPLQPSDQLPPLRELSFSGPPETYELDLKHCQLLKKCMDWTQLQRLDLGLSCPQYFFEEIGSQLISLKWLKIGIRTGNRYYEYWHQGPLTCEDLGTVVRFIESVPHLCELYITDLSAAAETIAPAILASQRSLEKFSYVASMYRNKVRRRYPMVFSTTQLVELYEQCPGLVDLELDFSLETGKWPVSYAESISQLDRLRHLSVVVELNNDASDFADEYHQTAWGEVPTPAFNEKLGREVSTDLFQSFYRKNPYAHLKDLKVSFMRNEVYDRGQHEAIEFTFKFQRLERDDAVKVVDGGFTYESSGKWVPEGMV